MSNEKRLEVPWGSESICTWCKKFGKCQMFTGDPEIPFIQLPSGANTKNITSEYIEKAGVRIRFTQLFKIAQISHCPMNEFEPDESHLPESLKGSVIVERS